MKVVVEMEKPRICGECRFYSERNYRCHNEIGIEAHCGMGYMHGDMRDKSYRSRLYDGCRLDYDMQKERFEQMREDVENQLERTKKRFN